MARSLHTHSNLAHRRPNRRRQSKARAAIPFGRRLRIEPLEDRRLLTVFTVTNLDDGLAPGTLRQAIFDAKQTPAVSDTIEFAAGLTGTIALSAGELVIDTPMSIVGPGADLLTIDAGGQSRVFNVDNGSASLINVEISGLTITGGSTDADGGGILNRETLSVSRSAIVNNSAEDGGGIGSFSGTFSLTDSTLSGNSASGVFGGGAGIFNFSSTKAQTSTISNSTLSNNTSTTKGGGVYNFLGTLIIQYSTITQNEAPANQGSGVATLGDTNAASTQVHSSIVSGNFNTDVDLVVALQPAVSSNGYNLVGFGTAAGAFGASGDQSLNSDPGLGPLADNGGPTQTHALLTGSPAIDAGNPSPGVDVPAFDQRGTSHERIFDGNDDSVVVIDIGAFEKDTIDFFVDTLDDEDDGVFLPGDFSLREAIGQAELVGTGLPVVQFVPGFFEAGPGTIFLTMGQLEVNNRMLIQGPGADLLTIDAQGNSRVFHVNDFEEIFQFEATISGMTLTGGNDGGGGGAVFSQEDLTVADCTVTGNTAEWGGGLYNGELGNMTVLRSTISGNTANASGGGLYSWINVVTVRDSTFSSNYAPEGAGIRNANNGYLFVFNSTITGNIADNSGGGLSNDNSRAVISYSTFGDNSAPDGAGISSRGASQLEIDHSTISGNPGGTYGGGILITDGTANISDSFISYNSADHGAGIDNSYGGDVTILRTTISGNTAVFDGGGIRNLDATVSILDSDILDNAAPDGGGIANFNDLGDLVIRDSTISGNRAEGGSGVFNAGGGVLNRGGFVEINYSTFSGNIARYGGGLYNEAPLAKLTLVNNSTFSDNEAVSGGGGIYNYVGHLVIEFSTVTENSSNDFAGSGIVSWGDDATTLTEIRSSIVAGNQHTDAAAQGPPGNTFESLGYNLIGVFGFAETFTQPGDQVIGGDDPLLGDLEDNGGPTLTHALLEGSRAIDAGDPEAVASADGVPEFDQRGPGFSRVFDAYDVGGPRIDIGAFEVNTIVAAPTFVGDYNRNLKVDAADYTIWRNTLHDIIGKYQGADGDGDGLITRDDYDVWKLHFGETPPDGESAATAAAQVIVVPSAPAEVSVAPSAAAIVAEPALAPKASASDVQDVPSQTIEIVAAHRGQSDLGVPATEPIAALRALPAELGGRMDVSRTSGPVLRSNPSNAAAARDQALLAWLADAELGPANRSSSPAAAELSPAATDAQPAEAVDAAFQSGGLAIAWQRLR